MREYPKKGCACGKARCSCSKGKMRSSKVQSFAVGGGVTPMERTMEAPASPMGGPQTKPAFGNKMPAPMGGMGAQPPVRPLGVAGGPMSTQVSPGPQTKPAFGNKMPAFAQPSAEPKPSKYMQRFQRKAAKFGMV